MGLKIKLVLVLVAVAGLAGGAWALYGWGKAAGRQECAEERTQALSDATRMRLAEHRHRTEQAEQLAEDLRREAREWRRAATERREQLDDYLAENQERGDRQCLDDRELRLFNSARPG